MPVPAKPADLHAKKRLVPLPKGGFKIVMRPCNGLDLRMWKPYQLVHYLAKAVGASAEEVSDAAHLQVNHNQNILAIHTEDERMAQALAQIHQLVLGGRCYPSYTYLAAPDDSNKGTIHDARPGSTMEELVRCIRTEDGTQIITARILGQFGSAIITFADRRLPHHVVYYGSRQWVTLYRPLKQVCTTCMKEGHRVDVCPTPGTQACPETRPCPLVHAVRWGPPHRGQGLPAPIRRSSAEQSGSQPL